MSLGDDISMGIRLREADLWADEAALLALTQANLDQTDPRRFHWLYRDNPFGPARAWLAFNGTDAPIGMCALFPRRAYVAGEEVLGCVLGDLCVSAGYRSLGPAIHLQRACMSCIDSGEFAFGYDFPSHSMLGVYRFLGVTPTQSSLRMVKLLRIDEKISAFTGEERLSQLISKPVNLALTIKDHLASDSRDLEFRVEDEPCLTEYARLARENSSSLGNCIARTPGYLNWRYRQHPYIKYEFFACYRHGDLRGYIVFSVADGRADIADFFGGTEQSDLTAMLSGLVSLLRSRGLSGINIEILDNDPRMAAFRCLGFSNRGSWPIINCHPKRGPSGPQLLLMHGDRES